jgi:AraC-like DNA-binding protein
LAKIAADLDEALAVRRQTGACGAVAPRLLAAGAGWDVADVVCTHGPADTPFEERHEHVLIALVAAGAFEYRSQSGRGLMTAGSVLLGNAGECFECAHRHAAGDRCIAFRYRPECFERIAADAGMKSGDAVFDTARIAPSRTFAPFVARASASLSAAGRLSWDEIALTLAASALRKAADVPAEHESAIPPATLRRVTQVLQLIDASPDGDLGIERLAKDAGLSPYHFLRCFQLATGTTPHQYVLRARLRAAAKRLADDSGKILDIALDCGFNDISNFNRAFRAEFRVTPREYRAASMR